MDFYSNSKPNLISSKIRNKVKLMTYKSPKIKSNLNNVNNIKSIFNDFLYYLYSSYIKPNKEILFIIIASCLFLWYRCQVSKKEKEDLKIDELLEEFNNEDNAQKNYNFIECGKEPSVNDIMRNISRQTMHMRSDIGNQPSMNPSIPVKDQYVEQVNYMPDNVPINIDGSGPRILNMPTSEAYHNLISPSMKHNAGINDVSRQYYTGIHNSYQNQLDTDIINPLGFPNNFNSTTDEYVDKNVNLNKQNLIDYSQILYNTNQNLTNSLGIGPNNLNIDTDMTPPYITNNNLNI
jgi:hypothetical protein